MKLKKDERRRIFHKHFSIPRPEEWARDEWPEGMASHLERLAGINAGIWVTGDYACRNALANLPLFHFITEKPLLRRGGVAAIVGALRRIFPDVPAWVLSHDVPDKNRFATSTRVHETALADFERRPRLRRSSPPMPVRSRQPTRRSLLEVVDGGLSLRRTSGIS